MCLKSVYIILLLYWKSVFKYSIISDNFESPDGNQNGMFCNWVQLYGNLKMGIEMREIVLCTWYTWTVRWITCFSIIQCSMFVCQDWVLLWWDYRDCYCWLQHEVLDFCSDADEVFFFVGCDIAPLADGWNVCGHFDPWRWDHHAVSQNTKRELPSHIVTYYRRKQTSADHIVTVNAAG